MLCVKVSLNPPAAYAFVEAIVVVCVSINHSDFDQNLILFSADATRRIIGCHICHPSTFYSERKAVTIRLDWLRTMYPRSHSHCSQRTRATVSVYNPGVQEALSRTRVPLLWELLYCRSSFYHPLGCTKIWKENDDLVYHYLFRHRRYQRKLYARTWCMYCNEYTRGQSGESGCLLTSAPKGLLRSSSKTGLHTLFSSSSHAHYVSFFYLSPNQSLHTHSSLVTEIFYLNVALALFNTGMSNGMRFHVLYR